MKENKFFINHAVHLASLTAILALVLIVPATATKQRGLGIALYILAGVCLVAGGVILYLAHRAKSGRKHCFLYDEQERRNLPLSELSAERIGEGMERYLSRFVEDTADLWLDIPKPLREQLQEETAFRPLLGYHMFISLGDGDTEKIGKTFALAGDRVIAYLCRALQEAGDGKIADYIFQMKKNGQGDGKVAAFFQKNHDFLADHALSYAHRNNEAFYMDR